MQHKTGKKQKSFRIFDIGLGVAVAVFVSVIGAAIGAFVLVTETLNQSSIPIIAVVAQFLSAFVGGVSACKRVGEKYVFAAGITTVCYLFLLVCITVLLTENSFHNFLPSLLSVMLGSALACTTCLMKRSGKWHRKRVHC